MMRLDWKLAELVNELGVDGVRVPARLNKPVKSLSVDSRALQKRDTFIATRGTRQHGMAFAQAALDAGVSGILYDPDGAPQLSPEIAQISVAIPGLTQRLGELAAVYYGHPSRDCRLVGVTGTDGKSSVAWLYAQAWSRLERPAGLMGTLGYGLFGDLQTASLTTPDALRVQRWLRSVRERGADEAVMEVSSHALDQYRVAGAAFDTAIFTNLGRDHLDYHETEEEYALAKQRLFTWPGLNNAVLNADDPHSRRIMGVLEDNVRPILFGTDEGLPKRGAEFIQLTRLTSASAGLQLELDSSWGRGILYAPLMGSFNASNLMAVLGALMAAQLDFKDALAMLEGSLPPPGRMERFGGGRSPLVVVDYAHTPQALTVALEACRQQTTGRLLCVFGCGGERDKGKRAEMGRVAESIADSVVITNDNPRNEDPRAIIDDILSGMLRPDAATVEPDRRTAIIAATSASLPGDAVLVAGKGHEAWQQVKDRRIPFNERTLVEQLVGGIDG